MPDGLNKVQLIGNLGKDPEMRYTQNGNAVTTFSMAVSRSYSVEGGRKEETEWFTVVTWNKLAELVGQHLVKGRRIYAEGRLQTRSWEGNDGAKHYRTEVVAERILFLDSGAKGGRAPIDDDGIPFDADDLPFE